MLESIMAVSVFNFLLLLAYDATAYSVDLSNYRLKFGQGTCFKYHLSF
jgi:hypothetical protein